MHQDIEILKQVSLFKGIKEPDIEQVLECLRGNVKQYVKNQVIVLTGNEISFLGIILDGTVQIIREDIMGNRMIVANLGRGEIFGETIACAGIKESPVSVVATEPSRILMLSINRIVTPCRNACNFHASLITNLLSLLAVKNLYLTNKMELLSKRTIREKLLAYLSYEAQKHHSNSFRIDLNRNELADYLCIDRSAMSRELSRMREEGIIEYQKNYFKIVSGV
ncbi:MAG: cAMP-binding domain of CRP or a regulatory subunit of cAMP-dependent protein kinases [Lachnoclostridium sp.]|jgi:CRP/FNR family transcriptional regulator, dissimilatory nitrate respiration regulator